MQEVFAHRDQGEQGGQGPGLVDETSWRVVAERGGGLGQEPDTPPSCEIRTRTSCRTSSQR